MLSMYVNRKKGLGTDRNSDGVNVVMELGGKEENHVGYGKEKKPVEEGRGYFGVSNDDRKYFIGRRADGRGGRGRK